MQFVGVAAAVPLDGITYTFVAVCQQTGTTATFYIDGVSNGTPETGAFTPNEWGTYFYIGSSASENVQAKGHIKSIAFFNRALTASEVVQVTNLM